MAQLVTADPRTLVTPLSLLGTGFAQGQQIGQQFANQRALAQQSEQQAQLSGLQRQALQGNEAALAQLSDPVVVANIQKVLASKSEAERAEIQRESKVLTRIAQQAKTLPVEQVRDFLIRKREEIKADDPNRATPKLDAAIDKDQAGMLQDIELQSQLGLTIEQMAERQQLKPQNPTSLQKNLIAAGLKPGTPEFEQAVLTSVTKPQTSVTVGGGDSAFQKELAKGQAKNVATVREEADAAIDANQSLSILENIDVNTGALEPAKQGLAAFANAFGLDGSKLASVSAGEAFNAEAQRLVLSVKATQKGPQTDKDEATIRKTVASLGNSQQGNQFIIDSARAMNNRKIGRKDFYDTFLEESGGKFRNADGVTADAAWSKFKRDTPMVSSKLRTPEGLPVFFFKFDDAVRSANPDATRAEILEAWRAADKRAK